jgi:hypothetical protein
MLGKFYPLVIISSTIANDAETPKLGVSTTYHKRCRDAKIGRLCANWAFLPHITNDVETPKLGVSVQIGRLCANWAFLPHITNDVETPKLGVSVQIGRASTTYHKRCRDAQIGRFCANWAFLCKLGVSVQIGIQFAAIL